MNRRQWLLTAPAVGLGLASLTRKPTTSLMQMTPGEADVIAGSHVGFLPQSRKRLFVFSGERRRQLELLIENESDPLSAVSIRLSAAPRAESPTALSLDHIRAQGAYRATLIVNGNHKGPSFSFDVARDR